DGIRDFHVTGVQTCALPIFADLISAEGRGTNDVVEHLRRFVQVGGGAAGGDAVPATDDSVLLECVVVVIDTIRRGADRRSAHDDPERAVRACVLGGTASDLEVADGVPRTSVARGYAGEPDGRRAARRVAVGDRQVASA